jgi:hypothetical protein
VLYLRVVKMIVNINFKIDILLDNIIISTIMELNKKKLANSLIAVSHHLSENICHYVKDIINTLHGIEPECYSATHAGICMRCIIESCIDDLVEIHGKSRKTDIRRKLSLLDRLNTTFTTKVINVKRNTNRYAHGEVLDMDTFLVDVYDCIKLLEMYIWLRTDTKVDIYKDDGRSHCLFLFNIPPEQANSTYLLKLLTNLQKKKKIGQVINFIEFGQCGDSYYTHLRFATQSQEKLMCDKLNTHAKRWSLLWSCTSLSTYPPSDFIVMTEKHVKLTMSHVKIVRRYDKLELNDHGEHHTQYISQIKKLMIDLELSYWRSPRLSIFSNIVYYLLCDHAKEKHDIEQYFSVCLWIDQNIRQIQIAGLPKNVLFTRILLDDIASLYLGLRPICFTICQG